MDIQTLKVGKGDILVFTGDFTPEFIESIAKSQFSSQPCGALFLAPGEAVTVEHIEDIRKMIKRFDDGKLKDVVLGAEKAPEYPGDERGKERTEPKPITIQCPCECYDLEIKLGKTTVCPGCEAKFIGQMVFNETAQVELLEAVEIEGY